MQRLDINSYIIETGSYFDEDNKPYLAFKDNNKFLLDWFNYDCNQRIGVYMLGDFYIGQSNNIRSRLINHSRNSVIYYRKHENLTLKSKLQEYFIKGIPIPLNLLSTKKKLEDYYIKRYRDLGYPLINKAPGIGPKWEILSND